ncbi:MAG TPA: PAS domain-containing sensor histidine kinase [Gemmatimonadaceae bacterium]|nr:PAS domain-containing sensor histidine kinase [Gemmatimonadaceae bacterium]
MADALQANLARGYLESEVHLRHIAETLDHIVFLTDPALTRIVFVNAAYETIWGRTRDELYRDSLAFLQGVHPDDRERLMHVLTARPGAGYETEFRVVRPDGELRWIWVRGFPVHGGDGTITYIAGIAEDTTDRKRVQESREQLVRGFTHDVKNPLGAADGHLALLLEGVYGPLTPEQADSITRARKGIHSAVDLIGQMLDIERAQTGTIDLHRSRFDLGDVLRELVQEYQPVAGARRMHLALDLPAEDPLELLVYSDPTRVRQIVGNLISNALKYTQEGGSCSVRARLVESTDELPFGPWVEVAVADDGPGIPADKQHLLFREFTRFSPVSADGSGIGLAISHQLARALDARLTFQSTVGVGSTFTLSLPKDRRTATSE